jgi:hypothetical protein
MHQGFIEVKNEGKITGANHKGYIAGGARRHL